MKLRTHLFTTLLIAISTSIAVFAQNTGKSHTIEQGDWLSKISDQEYGNPHLYYRIIESTNEKALSDKSYSRISSANAIEPGQKVWVPGYSSSSGSTEAELVSIPETNCGIRIWYNYQVVAISVLNEKWIADSIDLETRARKAYQLRHDARVNARFMMKDKEEVKQFQERDKEKYGNPDGPTFQYLMDKYAKEGTSQEECYEKIIASSSRVSPVYNNECL